MARLRQGVRAVERRPDVHQHQVFAFPQRWPRFATSWFSSSAMFSSSRLDQPLQLRGVYFTSGTQDGTQIDRLLGAIGRRFGVAPAVAPPPGRGKAYFVERLLKDVLIGESGLAGVNRRLEMKKAALQLGAYVAMGLIAVIGIIAMTVSYSRNRAYIAEAATDVATFRQVPAVAASAPLEALLPRLDAMSAVVDSTNRYRDDRPWGMRWGLFQGTSIGNAARDAYLRELDGILLPRFAARVKQRLGEYAREPEKLYIYLKAYLMLGEPKHLNKAHLQFLADLEWKSADGAVTAGDSASKHFHNLLEYGDTLRRSLVGAGLAGTQRFAGLDPQSCRIQASYAPCYTRRASTPPAAAAIDSAEAEGGLSLAEQCRASRPVFERSGCGTGTKHSPGTTGCGAATRSRWVTRSSSRWMSGPTNAITSPRGTGSRRPPGTRRPRNKPLTRQDLGGIAAARCKTIA